MFSQPNLAKYQEKQRNLPTSILKKKSPSPPLTAEPSQKKIRRKDSVEPLRNASPVPPLPDDLKQKQEQIDAAAQRNQRTPAPPREGSPKHKGRPSIQAKALTAQPKTDDSDFGDVRDPLQILKLIRENPKLGFLYLTPAVDRSSIEYNPYNIK